jgi:hypothetical protein
MTAPSGGPPPPPGNPPGPGDRMPRLPTSLDRIAEYGLTGAEWAALQLYTTSLYTLVNKHLRGYASPAEQRQIADFVERTAVEGVTDFDGFIALIESGMAKLPEYDDTDTVSRGLNLEPTAWNPQGLLQQYGEYQVVVDEGFMSTTFGTPFAKDAIVVLELPEGHPGRDLAWLSKFEQEKEILFPPGVSFIVTGQLDRGGPEFDGVLAFLVADAEERARRFGVVTRVVYGTIMNWQTNPLYQEPQPEWNDNPAYVPAGGADAEGWNDNPLYQEAQPEWHDNPLYLTPEDAERVARGEAPHEEYPKGHSEY